MSGEHTAPEVRSWRVMIRSWRDDEGAAEYLHIPSMVNMRARLGPLRNVPPPFPRAAWDFQLLHQLWPRELRGLGAAPLPRRTPEGVLFKEPPSPPPRSAGGVPVKGLPTSAPPQGIPASPAGAPSPGERRLSDITVGGRPLGSPTGPPVRREPVSVSIATPPSQDRPPRRRTREYGSSDDDSLASSDDRDGLDSDPLQHLARIEREMIELE